MQVLPSVALVGALLVTSVLVLYPLQVRQAGRRRLAVLGLSVCLLPLPLIVPGGLPASALLRFVVAIRACSPAWSPCRGWHRRPRSS